ncbi:uncharacterized protein LOC144537470 [Sander vitreus]
MATFVKYKTKQSQRAEGSADLPNLLQLEHVLHASKLQSNVEYRKEYKQAKAQYHTALDTAEQLHHRENAVLHSQVKYREEYERNKGRSQMDFEDTQTYKVTKEAQKMQSEVKLCCFYYYCLYSHRKSTEEYEDRLRVQAWCRLTPAYLTACHASSLLSEREYRREYEEQIKGTGLVDADQTPAYLTACHASSLLSEKAYRKDLEQEVKGRGLSGVGLEETPELLRVKNANQILNEKEYRRDLETDIVGKGMELSADVLDMQRAKRASEILKKYKHEAERLKGRYSLLSETPEMERVKANQRHISSLRYCWDSKLMRGLMSSVTETPEIVLARENAKRISDVQYREEVGHGTAVRDTPEMERVRRNQENISSVKYKQSAVKASSVGVTPELERVRQNQENISSVRYQRGLQEMRGRSRSELDTPEYRRVRKSQDSVSMVAAWLPWLPSGLWEELTRVTWHRGRG